MIAYLCLSGLAVDGDMYIKRVVTFYTIGDKDLYFTDFTVRTWHYQPSPTKGIFVTRSPNLPRFSLYSLRFLHLRY